MKGLRNECKWPLETREKEKNIYSALEAEEYSSADTLILAPVRLISNVWPPEL